MEPINFYTIPEILPGETFLPISRYKGRLVNWNYFISNYGRVYSSATKKFLSPRITHKGYLAVEIVSQHTTNTRPRVRASIHRLVMETFCPNPDMYLLQVNHKDGNKANNNLTNLEWATQVSNISHAMNTGLLNKKYLTDEDVINIRTLYNDGEDVVSICEMYADKVSYETIKDICANKSYMVKQNFYIITWDDINKIRELYNGGMSAADIWRNYYSEIMTARAIRNICSNRNWRDPNYIPRENKFSNSKFTQDDIIKIRKLYNEGWTGTDIHKEYYSDKVNLSSILSICRNERYIDPNYTPRPSI